MYRATTPARASSFMSRSVAAVLACKAEGRGIASSLGLSALFRINYSHPPPSPTHPLFPLTKGNIIFEVLLLASVLPVASLRKARQALVPRTPL